MFWSNKKPEMTNSCSSPYKEKGITARGSVFKKNRLCQEHEDSFFVIGLAMIVACFALILAIASYAQVRDLRQMIGG